MKKLMSVAILICVMMSTACAPTDKNNTAIIKASELSDETEKILGLLDDETMFFDYTVNETIKSANISVWVFENGEWLTKGDVSGTIDKPNNQIAFRFTDGGFELFNIDENGHSKYTSPYMYTGLSDTMSQASTRLSSTTEIILNSEIPLFVRIGSDANNISISDEFRDSDCIAGVAVTATFCEEALE